MRALRKGQSITTAAPLLQALSIVDGRLEEAEAVAFRILDPNGDQVEPASAGDTTSVDVVAHRLGRGRYAVVWSVPADADVGEYLLEVEYTVDGTDYSYEDRFEVLSGVHDKWARTYASVAYLREEGVTTADRDDRALHRILVQASQYVERMTGRSFDPAPKTLRLNGEGAPALLLHEPIVAVGEVKIDAGPYVEPHVAVALGDLRVYARHLTDDLLHPDDRDVPRIEFYNHPGTWGHMRKPPIGSSLGRLYFPTGTQNVQVEGVFGYTDPPGPLGRTPIEIEYATALLALRNLPRLVDEDERADARLRSRIESERTRDQSVKYASPRGNAAVVGRFTGDPEIDTILEQYRRPVRVDAV